jgi:SAM-dependent methyltransferase
VRWNSNLHAFDALLQTLPSGLGRGLDVGCGEGETARRLRGRVGAVVGIDPDEPSIAEARLHEDDITYVVGSLDDPDLEPASFDVVAAVAMLHHVDHADGLRRLAALVAPGGHLLVVGLAKSRGLAELRRDAIDAVTVRRHTLRKGVWETPAPKVWPPPMSYAESEQASLDVLPDATFRRVPYFRYALTWRNPA